MECPATSYLSLPENVPFKFKEAMSSRRGKSPHVHTHHDFSIIYVQCDGPEKHQVDLPSWRSVLLEEAHLQTEAKCWERINCWRYLSPAQPYRRPRVLHRTEWWHWFQVTRTFPPPTPSTSPRGIALLLQQVFSASLCHFPLVFHKTLTFLYSLNISFLFALYIISSNFSNKLEHCLSSYVVGRLLRLYQL